MDSLKNVIDEKRYRPIIIQLENSLIAFSLITKVPVTFFSKTGQVLWEYNKKNKTCIANSSYYDCSSDCANSLKAAMNISSNLGDVYIFTCNAELISMCYSFCIGEEMVGHFIAGPIAMGNSKERVLRNFYEKIPADTIDYPQLVTITSRIALHDPKDVAYLSILYLNSLNAPFVPKNAAEVKRQHAKEQSTLGSKIIKMKKNNIEIEYPNLSEINLIEGIKNGDIQSCKKLFSKYMEDIMVFEGGNLAIIKIRLITLFSQIVKPETSSKIDRKNISLIEAINNAATFENLMIHSIDFVTTLTQTVSANIYSGNSAIVQQAINFIRRHFTGSINLLDIAESIHVNPTYLSTLFKAEMGKSIVEYINEIRLNYAAKLLKSTNDSITEVALQCGFNGFSYFSRLFKEKFNDTPRQYRKLNSP